MICRRFLFIVSCILCCVVSIGCGPKRAVRADRSVVSGTVTFQGKPVSGGVITFTSSSGDTAGGMLREDGTYYIEDAPMGDTKVSIDTESIRPELGGRYVKLPAKYVQASTTDLSHKVEGGENTADFKLE
jgi:hypothetical protein